MIRAVAKGSLLLAFGRLPGGPHLYRTLTRKALGTQATHVDKLARVWPGYIKVWTEDCGFSLEGKRLWVHEGGWTPFPFLLGYVLTGQPLTVTNTEGDVLDRYVDRSFEALKSVALPDDPEVQKRKEEVLQVYAQGGLTAKDAIAKWQGKLHACGHSDIPLESSSIDLAHSGGVLEHYRLDDLKTFIKECYRVIAPGGVCSHVFDHRDHLYHADKKFPFLNHLRYSETAYRILSGHSLLFHNRLLPAQIVSMFEEAGFELIEVYRRYLPSLKTFTGDDAPSDALCGLDRTKLNAKFVQATDADLRTAAAHYLFRKPS